MAVQVSVPVPVAVPGTSWMGRPATPWLRAALRRAKPSLPAPRTSAQGTTHRCWAAALSSDRSALEHGQPQVWALLSPRVLGLQLQRARCGTAGLVGRVCQELGGMGRTWPHIRQGWRGLAKGLCRAGESPLAALQGRAVCEEACTAYPGGADSHTKEGREEGASS